MISVLQFQEILPRQQAALQGSKFPLPKGKQALLSLSSSLLLFGLSWVQHSTMNRCTVGGQGITAVFPGVLPLVFCVPLRLRYFAVWGFFFLFKMYITMSYARAVQGVTGLVRWQMMWVWLTWGSVGTNLLSPMQYGCYLSHVADKGGRTVLKKRPETTLLFCLFHTYTHTEIGIWPQVFMCFFF